MTGKAELWLMLLGCLAFLGVLWWFVVDWLPDEIERRREEREMREQAARWGLKLLPGRWVRRS